jgi:hypothetical protein
MRGLISFALSNIIRMMSETRFGIACSTNGEEMNLCRMLVGKAE